MGFCAVRHRAARVVNAHLAAHADLSGEIAFLDNVIGRRNRGKQQNDGKDVGIHRDINRGYDRVLGAVRAKLAAERTSKSIGYAKAA